MKEIWNFVNNANVGYKTKNTIFIGICIAIVFAIEKIVWTILCKYIPQITWLSQLFGFPTFYIGFVGGIIYLFNHEFKR